MATKEQQFASASAEYAEQYYYEVSTLAQDVVAANSEDDHAGYLPMLQLLGAARTSAQSASITYLLPRACLSMVFGACSISPPHLARLLFKLEAAISTVEKNIALGRKLSSEDVFTTTDKPKKDQAEESLGLEEVDETGADIAKDATRARLLAHTEMMDTDEGLNPETQLISGPYMEKEVMVEACEVWRVSRRVILNRIFPKPSASINTATMSTAALQLMVAAIIAVTRHSMYVSLPSTAAKDAAALAHPEAPSADLMGRSHTNTLLTSTYMTQIALFSGVQTSSLPEDKRDALLDTIGKSITRLDALNSNNLATSLTKGTDYAGFDVLFDSLRAVDDASAQTTPAAAEDSKSRIVEFDSTHMPTPIAAHLTSTKSLQQGQAGGDVTRRLLASVTSLRTLICDFVVRISTSQMATEDGFVPIADTLFSQMLLRLCFETCAHDMKMINHYNAPTVKTNVHQLETAYVQATSACIMEALQNSKKQDTCLSAVVLAHVMNTRASESEPSLAPAILQRALLEMESTLMMEEHK